MSRRSKPPQGGKAQKTVLQLAFEKIGITFGNSSGVTGQREAARRRPVPKGDELPRRGSVKKADCSRSSSVSGPEPRKRPQVKLRKAKSAARGSKQQIRPTTAARSADGRSSPETAQAVPDQQEPANARALFKEFWEEKMRRVPELLEERLVETASRTAPCQEELRELEQRLVGQPKVDPGGRVVEAVLGVDFGTSSTKIVARMPYESGQPTVAVTVPCFARAEEHPHLWASRLWLTRNGEFSLAPEEGAMLFCGLKAALMSERPESRLVMHVSDVGATALEAAAAFLALQMRQSRGWLLINRPEFSRQRIRWQYNIGFPAASLDDECLAKVYRRCCAAALALSLHEAPLTVDLVREAVCSTECEDLAELGIGLIAEIAAAVTGFAHSTQRDDELYTMVDVGATTLDSCTFNLLDPENEMKCSIFVAQVCLLGVQPLECWAGDLEFERYFEEQVSRSLRAVLWPTRTRRHPSSQRWKRAMPIFLIGGGSASEVHRRAVDSLDPWLRRFVLDSGGIEVRDISIPENLIHESLPSTVHRLTVAIGLSYPFFEIPEIMLPNAIEDVEPLVRKSCENAYIGKEHV